MHNILIAILIVFPLATMTLADTLVLNNGKTIACSKFKVTKAEIVQKEYLNGEQVSGNNTCYCDDDLISIDSVFSLKTGNDYYRVYGTGFVKRKSSGTISLYSGTYEWVDKYKDVGKEVMYDPEIKHEKLDLFCVHDSTLNRLKLSYGSPLRSLLKEKECSRQIVIKYDCLQAAAIATGGAGVVMTLTGLIDWLDGEPSGSVVCLTGIGLCGAGACFRIALSRQITVAISAYNR